MAEAAVGSLPNRFQGLGGPFFTIFSTKVLVDNY
jgi:hypothetical protein